MRIPAIAAAILLTACATTEPYPFEIDPGDGRAYVIGVDWGRHNDFTVITLLDAKTKRVAAFVTESKEKDAKDAGAAVVGGDVGRGGEERGLGAGLGPQFDPLNRRRAAAGRAPAGR